MPIAREIAKYVWTNPKNEEKLHVHCTSNPNILLLTSHSLARRKVQELVLTLNLTQEPKNALRLREVRLQKGPRGWGLGKLVSWCCYLYQINKWIINVYFLKTVRKWNIPIISTWYYIMMSDKYMVDWQYCISRLALHRSFSSSSEVGLNHSFTLASW